VDLLRQFEHAERRPQHGHFEFREHTLGGISRATLLVPGESRIIWQTFVPHRGRLQVFVAFPAEASGSVAVRVGVSDNRIYNTVAETTIATANRTAWVPVDADVSLYAGRKWSLFYRPDETKWRIILGTHVLAGTVANVYLGAPALVTDVEGAREFLRRQTR
jgi:hypothetical protein